MDEERDKFIRFSDREAARMLETIAKRDRRSEGNTVALLVRQEYARLFSIPNFDVRVEEALAVEGRG